MVKELMALDSMVSRHCRYITQHGYAPSNLPSTYRNVDKAVHLGGLRYELMLENQHRQEFDADKWYNSLTYDLDTGQKPFIFVNHNGEDTTYILHLPSSPIPKEVLEIIRTKMEVLNAEGRRVRELENERRREEWEGYNPETRLFLRSLNIFLHGKRLRIA